MISIKSNFYWAETKRKLVILALNYSRADLVKASVEHFKTSVPNDQWLYIIGNDGVDCDFSQLYNKNVRYFTLLRDDTSERNGSFIRNFFIKNCQSELLMQKDGEVVLPDDVVAGCINSGKPWRPGWIYVLTKQQTDQYLQFGKLGVKNDIEPSGTMQVFNLHGFPNKVTDFGQYSANFAKADIQRAGGGHCIATYYHYAYCVETQVLKTIGGYDEKFTHYGFEDSDMFCRLAGVGKQIAPDHSCRAIHLFHDKSIISQKLTEMGQIFDKSDPLIPIRNADGWGNG